MASEDLRLRPEQLAPEELPAGHWRFPGHWQEVQPEQMVAGTHPLDLKHLIY